MATARGIEDFEKQIWLWETRRRGLEKLENHFEKHAMKTKKDVKGRTGIFISLFYVLT